MTVKKPDNAVVDKVDKKAVGVDVHQKHRTDKTGEIPESRRAFGEDTVE